MISSFAKPSIQKGQLVRNTCTQQSGVVVNVFYNEFSGQHVYTVRVPGQPVTVLWNELCTTARASADALLVGDMVIVDDLNGVRRMGPIIEKTFSGLLIVQFDVTYAVSADRIWRAVPMRAMWMAVAS